MGGKPAVDVRYATDKFFNEDLSGAISTLAAKLQAKTELNSATKWSNVFGASNGRFPETAHLCIVVPTGGTVTLGNTINSVELSLPEGYSPWFPCTDANMIRISGTCEIMIIW